MAFSNSTDVAATGDVVAAGGANPGRHVRLLSVNLVPAAAVSTAVVRTGGATGTVLVRLQAAASGASVQWRAAAEQGVLAADGLHITLSGAGAAAEVEWAD